MRAGTIGKIIKSKNENFNNGNYVVVGVVFKTILLVMEKTLQG